MWSSVVVRNVRSRNLVIDIFTGPSDAHFVWKKNGQNMEVCVNKQSHALPDGGVHILSWVKDAVEENTEYHCSVISKAGSKTSKVLITVENKGRWLQTECTVSLGMLLG